MSESTYSSRAQAGTGARRAANEELAPEVNGGDDGAEGADGAERVGNLGRLSRERPRGRSSTEERDWARVRTLAVGLGIGLAIGAAVALLAAPMSGAETRDLIGKQARRLRGRAADEWDDLRDELRAAARRGGRRVRRGVTRSMTRGKWAAEDAISKVRRR